MLCKVLSCSTALRFDDKVNWFGWAPHTQFCLSCVGKWGAGNFDLYWWKLEVRYCMRGWHPPVISGCSGGGSKPIGWVPGNRSQCSANCPASSALGPVPGPEYLQKISVFSRYQSTSQAGLPLWRRGLPSEPQQLLLSLSGSAVPLIRVMLRWVGDEGLPEAGCGTSLAAQESLMLEKEIAKGNLQWNDDN